MGKEYEIEIRQSRESRIGETRKRRWRRRRRLYRYREEVKGALFFKGEKESRQLKGKCSRVNG